MKLSMPPVSPETPVSVWSQCQMTAPDNSLVLIDDKNPPLLVHAKKSFLRALVNEPNELAAAMSQIKLK